MDLKFANQRYQRLALAIQRALCPIHARDQKLPLLAQHQMQYARYAILGCSFHLLADPHVDSFGTGNTICSNATGIIDYTKGGPGPLDRCNPRCVSENDFPSRTWFGDTIHGVNMASDFPFWVEKFDGDQPNYGGNGN